MSAINAQLTSFFAKNLFDDSSSLTDILGQIQKEQSSVLVQDSNGKATLANADMLDNVAKPADKIKASSYVISALKVYTNAASQNGKTTLLADKVDEAAQVMDTLEGAVADLDEAGTLKSSKSALGTALTSLRGVMVQMNRLAGKMDASEAEAVTDKLKTMDAQASAMAKKAGLSWTSLYGGTSSADSSSSTTTDAASLLSSSDRLVDYLA